MFDVSVENHGNIGSYGSGTQRSRLEIRIHELSSQGEYSAVNDLGVYK